MGWASKGNGELLALAAADFDVFLTADRNLSYQQDVFAFDIAVIVYLGRKATSGEVLAFSVVKIAVRITNAARVYASR